MMNAAVGVNNLNIHPTFRQRLYLEDFSRYYIVVMQCNQRMKDQKPEHHNLRRGEHTNTGGCQLNNEYDEHTEN